MKICGISKSSFYSLQFEDWWNNSSSTWPFGRLLILETYFSETLQVRESSATSGLSWEFLSLSYSWSVEPLYMLSKVICLRLSRSFVKMWTYGESTYMRSLVCSYLWLLCQVLLFLVHSLCDLLIFQHFFSLKWCDKSLKNRSWCLALTVSAARWGQIAKHILGSPLLFISAFL